jgi:hypothetical protein
MSTTLHGTAAPTVVAASLPTVRFRRVSGAVALPLAFALQLACNSIYAWISTESGLSDSESSAETLQMYGRYPSEFLAMSALAMAGVLVMIPGLLAALRVLRPRKPRLALGAVVLMIAGYVSYFGIAMTGFDTLTFARYALAHPTVDVAAVLESAPENSVQLVFFLLFVLGNLGGTLLLGLAVILSRTLPWYAGVLIMGWTIGHLINIFGGGEWFAVAGGALEITGMAIVATAALRTTDVAWAARG